MPVGRGSLRIYTGCHVAGECAMHTISSSLKAPQDPRLRQTDGIFYATQLARVVVVVVAAVVVVVVVVVAMPRR